MAIVLYHHPFSRAAGVVWALEEVGVPYELAFVDILKGEQKAETFVRMNPMGKLPTLKDGDVVVTEGAAINLYLADRYSYGKLAPKVDDPARATYLRWSLFSPSVIEPGTTAKMSGWTPKESQVGWGSYDAMLKAMESAVANGFILGENFSMADVIFGGTLRYLVMVRAIVATPAFASYLERIAARPALQRADARNTAVMNERGLKTG